MFWEPSKRIGMMLTVRPEVEEITEKDIQDAIKNLPFLEAVDGKIECYTFTALNRLSFTENDIVFETPWNNQRTLPKPEKLETPNGFARAAYLFMNLKQPVKPLEAWFPESTLNLPGSVLTDNFMGKFRLQLPFDPTTPLQSPIIGFSTTGSSTLGSSTIGGTSHTLPFGGPQKAADRIRDGAPPIAYTVSEGSVLPQVYVYVLDSILEGWQEGAWEPDRYQNKNDYSHIKDIWTVAHHLPHAKGDFDDNQPAVSVSGSANRKLYDHGPFVTDIIHRYAPRADITLVEVMNPSLIGTVEVLVGMLDLVWKKIDERIAADQTSVHLINMSFSAQDRDFKIGLGDKWRHAMATEMNQQKLNELQDEGTIAYDKLRNPQQLLLRNGQVTEPPAQILIELWNLFDELKEMPQVRIIAAAGNDSTSEQREETRVPAAIPGVLGVGATEDMSGKVAIYSNFPDTILPPGYMVPGIFEGPYENDLPDYLTQEQRNALQPGRAVWEGTSFSAAMLTAMLAAQVGSGLSIDAALGQIQDGGPKFDETIGPAYFFKPAT